MAKESLHIWPTAGWPISEPEEQAIAPGSLEQLEKKIREQYTHIRSFLVFRQGALIFERYFHEETGKALHNFASGAKSFTSALIGIMLQQGYLENVQQKLVDFYEAPLAEVDPGIRQITIENLLMMASGLDWGDNPREVNTWMTQDNWLEKVFRLPISHQPGTHFQYKPDPRLLSWIIERSTGESVLSFAQRHLFEPLGIRDVNWPEGGVGDGIQLMPQDIAKLGYLYLRQGTWENEKLIASDTICASTNKQIQGGFPENDGFGYLWWVSKVGEYRVFYASGFGGQYMFVVPELDIIVVVTSRMDRPHLENKALVRDWLLSIGL